MGNRKEEVNDSKSGKGDPVPHKLKRPRKTNGISQELKLHIA
jgi:hypothetical protein